MWEIMVTNRSPASSLVLRSVASIGARWSTRKLCSLCKCISSFLASAEAPLLDDDDDDELELELELLELELELELELLVLVLLPFFFRSLGVEGCCRKHKRVSQSSRTTSGRRHVRPRGQSRP